jgi:hypothetical protein
MLVLEQVTGYRPTSSSIAEVVALALTRNYDGALAGTRGAGSATRFWMIRAMARSRTARTSSLVRPCASFQRVSARILACRTWGEDTVSKPGPVGMVGCLRDSQSASYTASRDGPADLGISVLP